MISGDKKLLVEGSEAYTRLQLQKAQVEQLDVFVWPQVHSTWDVLQAARENQYNVVTAQDPFWRGHLAWRAARLAGAKLNVQVHADLARQSWWRRILARLQLRRADSVRVVSLKIQKHVQAMGVTVPIHVLPVFVDLRRFRNIERQPHDLKTILWLGRFEAEKDPLYAVEVFRQVVKEVPGTKLVLLGSGSLETQLKKACADLAVEFPGWQDPSTYLAVADVVLSTSRHESWGASLVEALAAGVPVVAPDVGIAREAGALVVDRSHLVGKTVEVLEQGPRGELLIKLPSAEEWALEWKKSLL